MNPLNPTRGSRAAWLLCALLVLPGSLWAEGPAKSYTMTDGTVVVGVVVSETETHGTVQAEGGEEIEIAWANVASVEVIGEDLQAADGAEGEDSEVGTDDKSAVQGEPGPGEEDKAEVEAEADESPEPAEVSDDEDPSIPNFQIPEASAPVPPKTLGDFNPATSKFSDYVKTTLSFYIGDDNVLAGSDDGSPNLGMANEYPELFFEGLNSEKQAVVSESHMVLYGKMPGFLPFVDTEAAFLAEFELSRDPDDNQLIGSFRDDGSYVAVTFWFDRSKTGKKLQLTAWPYSADKFRLGYTYDLTWGGNTIWARNRGPVPGVKLHLDLERFYAFFGAKSLVRLRADNNETENFWGILGGLGPNVPIGNAGRLTYDLGVGYFSRGTFQQDPFRSTSLEAVGLSHRLQFTWNTQMGISPDLQHIINDPDKRGLVSMVPNYEGAFGFGVGVELTTLWQTLINADVPDSEPLWDDAITGGLFAQVRFLKNMRAGLDLVYRDVSFLVFNVPGLTPYTTFVDGTVQAPQVYGALWWDWYIEKAKLTPGVVFGLMQPASFFSLEDAAGERELQVIREANDYEIMPQGEGPFTILSVKGSLKWHLSHMMALIGEVSFTQDYNISKVVTDTDTGVGSRVLDNARAQQLGLNFILQARF